jgi:hypothetical protein
MSQSEAAGARLTLLLTMLGPPPLTTFAAIVRDCRFGSEATVVPPSDRLRLPVLAGLGDS